jgi:hypothetical protein
MTFLIGAGFFGAVATPTAGTVTALTGSPGATTFTFTSGYTPTTADAAVVVQIGTGQSTAETAFSMTVCGQGVTFPSAAHASIATTNRAEIAVGYVRGLTIGAAGNVVMTHSSQTMATLGVFLVPLSGWGGTVGNGNALQQAVSASTSLASTSITVAKAGSLLVGGTEAAGTSALQPVSATGWTKIAETMNGTSADGAIFTKTAGAAGATETLSPVASTTATVSATALLEFEAP